MKNLYDTMDRKGEGRVSRLRLLLAGAILLVSWLLSSGCGVYSAVPVTLQEIKHYVVEQEESYSAPLRRVVRAAAAGLEELRFVVDRVECDEHRGYLAAHWRKDRVTLKFTAITPTLTKVENRILKDGGWRDFASEKELFAAVHRALEDGAERTRAWQRAVRRLVPLHQQPEPGATVVAWIRPEVAVRVDPETSRWPRWAAIGLEMGGVAFLDQDFYPLDRDFSRTALSDVSDPVQSAAGDDL